MEAGPVAHHRRPEAIVVLVFPLNVQRGDPLLLDDIFSPEPHPDKYLRAADHRSGAYSILTGVAANQSMRTGRLVRIDELVQKIGAPDYPPMPSAQEPISVG